MTIHDKVLLDEFDHCDPETWEAFYHIFDEGTFTNKKISSLSSSFAPGGSDAKGGADGSATSTRQISCSKTLWLLTTNRFDADISHFNERNAKAIQGYHQGHVSFSQLHETFESFIRPKLRQFFQGGLTRRIDAIVPFFKFDAAEVTPLVCQQIYINLAPIAMPLSS